MRLASGSAAGVEISTFNSAPGSRLRTRADGCSLGDGLRSRIRPTGRAAIRSITLANSIVAQLPLVHGPALGGHGRHHLQADDQQRCPASRRLPSVR